jgi:hypothetical protein
MIRFGAVLSLLAFATMPCWGQAPSQGRVPAQGQPGSPCSVWGQASSQCKDALASELARTLTPTGATVVRWQEEATHRAEFFVQGQLVHAVERDGLTVSACLEDTGHEMRALVAVLNDSKQDVDVNPAAMTLQNTLPKEKVLAFIDPDKVAKSKRHVSGWARPFIPWILCAVKWCQ